ncbi:RNA polymerase sigma factor [Lentzea sp. NPDC102401]|uniref:RNA polymerase sigma factor n=1 Tax=Lentzea sp. NPDC102401 TaxID=3364128 RepID=UPI003807F49D
MSESDSARPASSAATGSEPDRTGGRTKADDAAFDEFYRAYAKSLVALLLIQGASLADAAELAQETLCAAYQSWLTIEHPKAWTRRVASRALIRRQLAERETPVDQLPPPSGLLRGDVDIEHWERQYDLLRALEGLPHRQRHVMALHLDDVDNTEIAAELSITSGAVREHLSRARHALRNWFFPKDGDL